jgi:ribosomal protein L35
MPCTKHLSEKKKQEQISKCKKAEIVNTEQIVGLIAILGR